MDKAEWMERFHKSRKFPNSYTAIDCETSGLDTANDVIVAIGILEVNDGKPGDSWEIPLNWPRYLIDKPIYADSLSAKIAQTQANMARSGKSHHYGWDMLARYGQDVGQALGWFYKYLTGKFEKQALFIMHNGWRFDVPLIENAMQRVFSMQISFPENSVYDTGVTEKAAQLPNNELYLPSMAETLRKWAYRAGDVRAKGVKWALDAHCEQTYGLTKKAGVDASEFHMASRDAIVLHTLFQEHRKLAGFEQKEAPTVRKIAVGEELSHV